MKKLLYAVLALVMLAGMYGCTAAPTATQAPAAPAATQPPAAPAATQAPASGQTGGAIDGKGMSIGLSMDSLESAFWVANEKAIKAQAEKDNVKLVEVIAEGDANKQNQQVENLIAQGVKAIIIAPKDGSAIEAAVQKAHDAGIPVIMDNRPVQGTVNPDLQILSDNSAMATQALQWFVDKAKKENKTYKALLLIGALSDQNAIERKTGHMAVLDANKDVINVVAQVPSEWKQDVALAGIQNAFQANPDINLIITPSDFLLPPIQSALEQIGKWKKIGEDGHISLVTFDGDENGMSALKNGYSEVDAAQSADGTGFAAVDWAIKLANGEKPAQMNLLDPGKIATLDNKADVWPTIWGWAGAK
jgi:ABC-type sugar transport system substrate-binding protein